MHFGFLPEEEAFRQEVRAFIREHMTPDVAERLGLENSPERRSFMDKIAAQGWFAMGWPPEYGGTPGTRMMRIILNEELAYAGAPNIGISVLSVGHAILKHGSEELKREFLPGILTHQILFAFGYTEPSGGSDLASLRTTAVRDGDTFVVNGSKKFITPAHYAHYMWTAVRTDPDVERHAGISMLIIPLDSPGITAKEIKTLGDWRTNEVVLENVVVPARYLVGSLNSGWSIITGALADERLYPHSPMRRSVETLVAWACASENGERRPADDPTVRRRIARLAARMEAAYALFLRQVSAIVGERDSVNEAAMNKIAITMLDLALNSAAFELVGEDALVKRGEPDAVADGMFENDFRAAVVGPIAGGSNEVLKNTLAKRRLGLPSGA